MGFCEIGDGGWELIGPLLPPGAGTGRPRIDDRMVFFMFLLPVADGWICRLSMVLMRLLGIGLSVGVLRAYGSKGKHGG